MPRPGQRDGAHDFEIKERQSAGAADFLDVFHAGYAGHHSAKDDWCNQHLDELDEPITQGLHFGTNARVPSAQEHTECNGQDDLEIERRQESFHAANSKRFEDGDGI
jgi:hypothetical protein